jgi:two-component system response regulator LytT
MIVDDDDLALSYLRCLIDQTPFLNLISYHTNATDALTAIENDDLQLVFLDINMPDLSGIELARIINAKKGTAAPRIIFTSGFERYALDGYKVGAIDYLLKPIEYEDFITASYKAKAYIENDSKQVVTPADYAENDFIFLRVEYELVKIYLKNILYFEGFKDYVKVFVINADGYIKSLITMKNLELKLPAHSFMRIHRSFIVSIDKIDTITKKEIKINKITIPVSEQYKDAFKKFTDQWF